ncbi:MAG TPA: MgtC/SapB family protein [Chitinophagaceae bacterium]|nr:MgtC/SapB family protein [Chitinophagaceae bacterium]
MLDQWEIWDVYKALLALAAGIILGLERELKDKAAGLKTITIICLGSALFAIISYRVGGDVEPTRIASYIVSGIGFIGAGVIFKDAVSVSGLTTAGIIWLAAAVGMSIGFGEFYLAGTFIVASLLIIFFSPVFNKIFRSKKQTRLLNFTIDKADSQRKQEILSAIRDQGIAYEERKTELKDNHLIISLEIVVTNSSVQQLEDYLIRHEQVIAFSF